MKKQSIKSVLAVIASVAVITGCQNNSSSKHPGFEDMGNGLSGKFHKQDKAGKKPVEGDYVQVYLKVKNHKDSVLTDSKDPKTNRPGVDYYEFPLMKAEFKGGYEDGLSAMAVGDSATFLISVDSMYKSKPIPPFLSKGTVLTYETKLLKIIPKEEVEKEQKKKQEEQMAMMELRKNEEPKTLAKYIEDNKIKVKPSKTGLYYIETLKGKGPKPVKGDSVKVNYTGRLLDGTVFDTSVESVAKEANIFQQGRPYGPINIAIGEGQVIKGWDEGIMMMNVGSKGKLIIPSEIAYGANGGGPIPPYSTLIFDVELVDKSTPPKK